MVRSSTILPPKGWIGSYTSSAISSSCLELRWQLHYLPLDLIPDSSNIFRGFAFRVFEMPLDQLFLHLSNNRFRTSFFDGAAHRYDEARVPDQFWREGLRMTRGRSIPSSRITSMTVGLIRAEGIVPALSAFIPCFLAKALGHLASSCVLNTDKQYGTLGQPCLSRRI